MVLNENLAINGSNSRYVNLTVARATCHHYGFKYVAVKYAACKRKVRYVAGTPMRHTCAYRASFTVCPGSMHNSLPRLCMSCVRISTNDVGVYPATTSDLLQFTWKSHWHSHSHLMSQLLMVDTSPSSTRSSCTSASVGGEGGGDGDRGGDACCRVVGRHERDVVSYKY